MRTDRQTDRQTDLSYGTTDVVKSQINTETRNKITNTNIVTRNTIYEIPRSVQHSTDTV